MFHYSPSGAALRKIEQIKDYLLSDGTCKCGLPCPFQPEHFFEFNPQVSEWQKIIKPSILTKINKELCCRPSTIETCWILTWMIVDSTFNVHIKYSLVLKLNWTHYFMGVEFDKFNYIETGAHVFRFKVLWFNFCFWV